MSARASFSSVHRMPGSSVRQGVLQHRLPAGQPAAFAMVAGQLHPPGSQPAASARFIGQLHTPGCQPAASVRFVGQLHPPGCQPTGSVGQSIAPVNRGSGQPAGSPGCCDRQGVIQSAAPSRVDSPASTAKVSESSIRQGVFQKRLLGYQEAVFARAPSSSICHEAR